jgi:hypothetical protein
MIALAPPRPVDRLSLEQHSRALEERSKWAASGFDASSGLLDAVCEAEAEVLQRGNEIRRPLSSLAPTDMHLPVLSRQFSGFSRLIRVRSQLKRLVDKTVGLRVKRRSNASFA